MTPGSRKTKGIKHSSTRRRRNYSGCRGESDNEVGMVSNILDNFDDIDSEEQSMFINLNIRNRR